MPETTRQREPLEIPETTAALPRLLGSRQLYDLMGAGRTWAAFQKHLRRLAQRGELVPIKVGPQANAWRADEVARWIETRPRTRRPQPETEE